MKTSHALAAFVIAVPLGTGALAGCGGGDTAQGGNGGAGSADTVERRAAGAFTVVSQREITLATSKYSSGDWEPGGSPSTLNGLSLTYGEPVTVPLRSKGGKEATFVLTVGGERTKVKVRDSSCIGFTADWYSGYSPERGISGMRIACAGEGFTLRGTAQF